MKSKYSMRKAAAFTTLLAAGQCLTPSEARDRHLRRTPPAAEAEGGSSARRQGHRRRRKGADLRKRRALIIGEEDITEDVGFFTRMLQVGSLPPPTPRPTPVPSDPPITPAPIDAETLEPTPFPVSFAPSPAPSTNQPTLEPSDSPTFPCNLTPDQRAADIRALMSTVTDPALFDDPSTPQARALDWITNEDAIEPVLCPDLSFCGMVQRYILAAFYFATDGADWSQCSAPEDLDDPASVAAANAECNRVVTPFGVANERVGDTSTDAWLGPVNECQWGGIACWGSDTPNLDLCIDQLDFGECQMERARDARESILVFVRCQESFRDRLIGSCRAQRSSLCNNNRLLTRDIFLHLNRNRERWSIRHAHLRDGRARLPPLPHP